MDIFVEVANYKIENLGYSIKNKMPHLMSPQDKSMNILKLRVEFVTMHQNYTKSPASRALTGHYQN